MAVGKNIDLNKADLEELARIPGIDRERAKALIEYRNQHGSFSDWEGLSHIPGFSKGMINDLKSGGACITDCA